MNDATYAPPNLGDLTTTPTRNHKCGPGGSYTFQIRVIPKTTTTSTGSETATSFEDYDAVQVSGAATRTDCDVVVDQLQLVPNLQKSVTLETSDAAVIQAPEDGVAIGVATGNATIVARAADGEVSAEKIAVSVVASSSLTYLTGPKSGSLAEHQRDQMLALTSGKPRSSMPIWSTRNNATATYAWNEDCWGASIANITCMSPYNTGTGNGCGGVLITPRHVAFTHHVGYYPKIGKQIRYVTPSNVTESFTIEDLAIHPKAIGTYTSPWDLVVAKLDRDVPSSIQFAKCLPASVADYIPSQPTGDSSEYISIPTFENGPQPYLHACLTTQDKVLATSFIRDLPDSNNGMAGETQGASVAHWMGTNVPASFGSSALGASLRSGDSGHPAFILVNNELVLVNLWSTPMLGYAYHTDLTRVNAMLDELGGGYNLTEVDLSEFPTY